jgi:hypothetical protein
VRRQLLARSQGDGEVAGVFLGCAVGLDGPLLGLREGEGELFFVRRIDFAIRAFPASDIEVGWDRAVRLSPIGGQSSSCS